MYYKVLVIDDNEDILFMLKAMLQLKEYNVFVKETINNIESYVEELAPDVIIMDMLLSGADGCDICRQLKSNNAIAAIPVVMISAMPNAKQICLEAAADYFVGKPFEMADLFNAISAAIEKKELSSV